MPLFPAFIDISQSKVLVVGGGKVAKRKVRNLLKFTRNITIVADRVEEELVRLAKEEGLNLKRRKFRIQDLAGVDMVIVAVDKVSLQRRIYRECQRRGILCNSVDSPLYCNFIFPSLVVRGDLVIGISTSGKVPALSRKIREKVEECLPENVEDILRNLEELRNSLPKGEERQRRIIEAVESIFKAL